jgi:hypothetical protein
MEMRLALVPLPVVGVDASKAFSVDQAGRGVEIGEIEDPGGVIYGRSAIPTVTPGHSRRSLRADPAV